MSVHSYSRCWLHMIWTTLNRERMLFGEAAGRVLGFLSNYAESKGIYMKWCLLSLAIQPSSGRPVHCSPGGALSEANVLRRISTLDQTIRLRMAFGRNR